MQRLLTELINLIFPLRPTQKILQGAKNQLKQAPYSLRIHHSCLYLSLYQDSLIHAATVENKFYRNKHASLILSNLLLKWSEKQTLPTLYIPIPLGPNRFRSRGYNQVENILKEIKENIEIETKLLIRETNTKPQTELNKKERLKNIKNAFIYNGGDFNYSRFSQIIIVDDVVTTGATLNEARASLAPHVPPNIKIICLAISH